LLDVDLDTATDNDIVVGYLELGFTEDEALAYIAQIRITGERYPD
jgi:hypothetical protein